MLCYERHEVLFVGYQAEGGALGLEIDGPQQGTVAGWRALFCTYGSAGAGAVCQRHQAQADGYQAGEWGGGAKRALMGELGKLLQ
jgi:hypothetical protein